MHKTATASVIAMLLTAGAAMAQTTSPGAPAPGATALSATQCGEIWSRHVTTQNGTMSEAQAKGIVTNFKSADTNNNGSLTREEFLSACSRGLVVNSAGSGSGSGGSGTTMPKNPGAVPAPAPSNGSKK